MVIKTINKFNKKIYFNHPSKNIKTAKNSFKNFKKINKII